MAVNMMRLETVWLIKTLNFDEQCSELRLSHLDTNFIYSAGPLKKSGFPKYGQMFIGDQEEQVLPEVDLVKDVGFTSKN